MDRLRGIDAAFLAIETPASHMAVAALVMLEPATAPGAWSFDTVAGLVGARLHLSPLFRRRVVEVPFGLHHPVWCDDPGFELAGHLHRLPVEPPGGRHELLVAVAAVLATPLDRHRPLWDLHVAEGLADGLAAVLARSHHAASDGVSGTEVLTSLLDFQPEPSVVAPGPGPWSPGPLPTEAELIADALAALAGRPAEAAAAVRGTIDLLTRLGRHAGGPVAMPFTAPRTSLNVALSGPQRRVALADLALDEVRAVKERFGVTVNDVVLALCASSLRAWLAARGEHPGADLVALVPASVRAEPDAATLGNQVSPMLVSLATGVADPVERLAAIAASARAAKAQEREVGSAVLVDWAELAPPAVVAGAAQLAAALRLADLVPPVFNVSVSNVVGPPLPLYLAGARAQAVYPLGPVTDGGGLNVTVLGYAGRLGIGLVADRETVPGLDAIAAGLADALAELVEAARC